MKRFPFHYYLLYLISRNESNKKLNQLLEQKKIYPLTKEEIDSHRKSFFSYNFPPSLRKVFQKAQRKISNVDNFYAWLKELKIAEFWLLDSRFKKIPVDKKIINQACGISTNNQARRVVELLLRQERDVGEIVSSLTECNITMEPEAINLYEHYFYNLKELSEEDWYEYYRRQEDNMKEIYQVSLRDDYNYSRWVLGLNPTLTYHEVAKQIMYDAFYKHKEGLGSKGEIDWARLSLTAVDKVRTNEKEQPKEKIEDVMEKLGQLKMEYDDTKYKTIGDIKKEEK